MSDTARAPYTEMTARQYSEWLTEASGEANVCGKKRRYATEDGAQHAAKNRADLCGEMQAYHCAYCGYWHIGHTPDPAYFGIKIVADKA